MLYKSKETSFMVILFQSVVLLTGDVVYISVVFFW